MHDAESPPTPSLHLHTARTKGWELLIGRCHEWHPLHKQAALLCAPPQLLWQQTSCWAGCKAANIPWSLHSEHLDHGFMSKIVGLPSFWGVFQWVNAEIKRERQTSVQHEASMLNFWQEEFVWFDGDHEKTNTNSILLHCVLTRSFSCSQNNHCRCRFSQNQIINTRVKLWPLSSLDSPKKKKNKCAMVSVTWPVTVCNTFHFYAF